MNAFFPGFVPAQIQVSGATINLVHGGRGPALLLLHGYPQTHCIWHRIAPRLADAYPGLVMEGWIFLVAPSGTPASIVQRMNSEVDAALKEPPTPSIASLSMRVDG